MKKQLIHFTTRKKISSDFLKLDLAGIFLQGIKLGFITQLDYNPSFYSRVTSKFIIKKQNKPIN